MPNDEISTQVFATYPIQRWEDGALTEVSDRVAEELPISFVYNGLAYAVMMASPADLEDYALGFSLSEGVVASVAELAAVEVVPLDEGMLIRCQIPEARAAALETQRRNLAGRTACGLCGAESIEQVVRHPPHVAEGTTLSHQAVHRALDALSQRQVINAMTGAVHAAAWANAQGDLLCVREDVGRHNALDKMIGALLRARVPLADGAALITSRASFEMVQKAAMAGIPILAAVSAPTGLAVRLAREAGLTLVGFARGGRHNVYAHPRRLIEE